MIGDVDVTGVVCVINAACVIVVCVICAACALDVAYVIVVRMMCAACVIGDICTVAASA